MAMGKGPTMSNPHWANSQGVLISVSSSVGYHMKLLKCWHLSHAFTYDWASFCVMGQ